MAAISKPLLPPKRGYVEKENPVTKERYYEKVETATSYSAKRIVITESQNISIPASRNQSFHIELVGGGASYLNSVNGEDGKVEIRDIILEKDQNVYVSIGEAGKDGSNGGTTSFGEHFYALGGVAGSENIETVTSELYEYGKGGTEDSEATCGICVIAYEAPIY